MALEGRRPPKALWATTLARDLASDLRRYGQHLAGCQAWGSQMGGTPRVGSQPKMPEKCNCGLVIAFERANEL